MPRTGFLGWAYISGSTVSFDTGIADKQVLFMSGTSVVSGTDNFQYDYNTDTLTVTGNMTISGTLRADTFIHREVENITSTGSTLFGDSTDDRHIRTGSLEVSSSAGVLYYNQSLALNVPFTGTNIVPFADDTYDIGADGNIFRYIYANELVGNVDGAVNFTAKNDEGDSITRGQAVYIKGVSGQTPTVALAACDDSTKMPAFGLAASDAAQGANLQIVSFGNIKNLNLSSIYDGLTFSVGDVLYIATGSGGTSGSLTNVPPTGSNNLLQNMAKVVRNGGGGDGQLRVGGAGRTNATPNLDAGYIFVGNSTDQSVQDSTIYVDIAASKVGINNTSPVYSLDVTGASGINLFDSGNNNKLTIDSNGLQYTGQGGNATLSAAGDAYIQTNGSIFLTGTLYNAATFTGNAAYVLKNDVGYLSTDDSNAGNVLLAGSNADTNVAIGNVVYLDNTGTWYQASAAATGSGDAQLIGISLSAAPQTDGILTRGIYQIATSLLSSSVGAGSLDEGSQVYISPSTAGGYTTVRPTSTGEIVRVVGHSVDTNKIFFNPSPDFVEI